MMGICCFRHQRVHSLSLLLSLALSLVLLPATAKAASPADLLNAGRADDALRLLIPQATGNNAAAFNYLGRVYFALGDWDKAVRNCERATQIEPRNAEFQLWLGRSYGEKASAAGPFSAFSLARKSVAAFSAAHTLDRQSAEITRALGEYYANAPSIVGGGHEKALALASELEAAHPADAAWLRAEVASNAGNYEQAEREYLQSIHLEHDSASTLFEYARFLRARKRWEDFEKTLERAMSSARINPSDRYDIAEMLFRTNRKLPVAAQQMRAYIQSGHPDESAPMFRAHFLLGEVLLKTGDVNQAAAEYRSALSLASTYRPAADALGRLGKR